MTFAQMVFGGGRRLDGVCVWPRRCTTRQRQRIQIRPSSSGVHEAAQICTPVLWLPGSGSTFAKRTSAALQTGWLHGCTAARLHGHPARSAKWQPSQMQYQDQGQCIFQEHNARSIVGIAGQRWAFALRRQQASDRRSGLIETLTVLHDLSQLSSCWAGAQEDGVLYFVVAQSTPIIQAEDTTL